MLERTEWQSVPQEMTASPLYRPQDSMRYRLQAPPALDSESLVLHSPKSDDLVTGSLSEVPGLVGDSPTSSTSTCFVASPNSQSSPRNVVPDHALQYAQQHWAMYPLGLFGHGPDQSLAYTGLTSILPDSASTWASCYPWTAMSNLYEAPPCDSHAVYTAPVSYQDREDLRRERCRMVKSEANVASPSDYGSLGDSSASQYGIPDAFFQYGPSNEQGVAPTELTTQPSLIFPSAECLSQSSDYESTGQSSVYSPQLRVPSQDTMDESRIKKRCNPTAEERSVKDEYLLRYRNSGLSYKEIKLRGGFEEAESTLRGRMRVLSKPKHERVRKPKWYSRDVSSVSALLILAYR